MKWMMVLLVMLMMGCQLRPVAAELPRQTRVAFATDRDGDFEIYVMNREGDGQTNLTNEGNYIQTWPTWSPQARALAFISDEPAEGLGIYRMDSDGQNVMPLVEGLDVIPSPLLWSPTGEWLAFGVGREGNPDVYIVDAAGETIINLSDDPGEDLLGSWSPDGGQFLFASTRDGGNLALYLVSVPDGAPVQITSSASNSGRPAWSPEGRYIAYMTSRDGNLELYRIDTRTGEETRLTDNGDFDGFPLWSPDGSKIAFLSDRDGNAEIYVMNSDGSDPTNLTNSPRRQESIQGDFAWSPDGTQILFHSNHDGDMEVYVMDADGGNVTNLSDHPAIDWASTWMVD